MSTNDMNDDSKTSPQLKPFYEDVPHKGAGNVIEALKKIYNNFNVTGKDSGKDDGKYLNSFSQKEYLKNKWIIPNFAEFFESSRTFLLNQNKNSVVGFSDVRFRRMSSITLLPQHKYVYRSFYKNPDPKHGSYFHIPSFNVRELNSSKTFNEKNSKPFQKESKSSETTTNIKKEKKFKKKYCTFQINDYGKKKSLYFDLHPMIEEFLIRTTDKLGVTTYRETCRKKRSKSSKGMSDDKKKKKTKKKDLNKKLKVLKLVSALNEEPTKNKHDTNKPESSKETARHDIKHDSHVSRSGKEIKHEPAITMSDVAELGPERSKYLSNNAYDTDDDISIHPPKHIRGSFTYKTGVKANPTSIHASFMQEEMPNFEKSEPHYIDKAEETNNFKKIITSDPGWKKPSGKSRINRRSGKPISRKVTIGTTTTNSSKRVPKPNIYNRKYMRNKSTSTVTNTQNKSTKLSDKESTRKRKIDEDVSENLNDKTKGSELNNVKPKYIKTKSEENTVLFCGVRYPITDVNFYNDWSKNISNWALHECYVKDRAALCKINEELERRKNWLLSNKERNHLNWFHPSQNITNDYNKNIKIEMNDSTNLINGNVCNIYSKNTNVNQDKIIRNLAATCIYPLIESSREFSNNIINETNSHEALIKSINEKKLFFNRNKFNRNNVDNWLETKKIPRKSSCEINEKGYSSNMVNDQFLLPNKTRFKQTIRIPNKKRVHLVNFKTTQNKKEELTDFNINKINSVSSKIYSKEISRDSTSTIDSFFKHQELEINLEKVNTKVPIICKSITNISDISDNRKKSSIFSYNNFSSIFDSKFYNEYDREIQRDNCQTINYLQNKCSNNIKENDNLFPISSYNHVTEHIKCLSSDPSLLEKDNHQYDESFSVCKEDDLISSKNKKEMVLTTNITNFVDKTEVESVTENNELELIGKYFPNPMVNCKHENIKTVPLIKYNGDSELPPKFQSEFIINRVNCSEQARSNWNSIDDEKSRQINQQKSSNILSNTNLLMTPYQTTTELLKSKNNLITTNENKEYKQRNLTVTEKYIHMQRFNSPNEKPIQQSDDFKTEIHKFLTNVNFTKNFAQIKSNKEKIVDNESKNNTSKEDIEHKIIDEVISEEKTTNLLQKILSKSITHRIDCLYGTDNNNSSTEFCLTKETTFTSLSKNKSLQSLNSVKQTVNCSKNKMNDNIDETSVLMLTLSKEFNKNKSKIKFKHSNGINIKQIIQRSLPVFKILAGKYYSKVALNEEFTSYSKKVYFFPKKLNLVLSSSKIKMKCKRNNSRNV